VGSASLQFLAFAFAVVVVFNVGRSLVWRQWVLLAANIGFLGFFSHNPLAFLPLAMFLCLGFLSLRMMQTGKMRAFIPVLLISIIGFMWLKKYTFIPASFLLQHPYLTIGLSYILFRVLHLIVDARNGDVPDQITPLSYLNYTLNFTTLVSGPIQRYQEFAAMQLAPLRMDIFIAGRAIERIVIGFFKVNVLSLFLSMIQSCALNSMDSLQAGGSRVSSGIVIAAAYPLYLYCNFSGYIDIVIGIARFLRIELPENFDRPFSSDNFIIFWSRWHITLSLWLKTYVYNPVLMGLMRRWPSRRAEPFLGVFAFFVTFFLVGVWHGQTSVFIFFGVLQGLGVSLTKLYQVLMGTWIGRGPYKNLSRHWLYNIASRGLTFTWFTFTLLWFWSNWSQLRFLAGSFHPREMALVWIAIFLGSSAVLALWEAARELLISIRFQGNPLVLSRYFRTAWGTALVVVAVATILFLSAPAPDIVYKAF
jgi:D-alanyl-lipoteichoic acid acyltransferase DltB (MBOAT superfamily)